MNPVKEIELNPSTTGNVLNVLFAGDLCPMGRNQALFINDDSDALYNDLLPILGEVDLSIANLECPLTDSNDSLSKVGPNLRADPQCVRGIQAWFQVVSLANNHIMDFGVQGLTDTLDVCRQSGIQTVGAGQNLADAQAPLFMTIKGIRIAILAITEQEFSIATEHSPGAAPVDPIDNYRQINHARQQADLVFVMLHGGNEHWPLPSPRLVKLCRFLVDVGSSLVVCNHAHFSGGMEIYRDRPIVYLQSDFIFDEPPSPRPDHRYRGYLLQVKASREGVASLRVVPYVQPREEVGAHRMYGEAAEQFLQEFDRLSSVIIDSDALNHAWQEFCRANQYSYLARFLRWGRVKRAIMRRLGLEPSRFLSPERANRLLNWFRCESHHDALMQILADVASKR